MLLVLLSDLLIIIYVKIYSSFYIIWLFKKKPKTQCNSLILCSISQIKLFLEIHTEQFAIGKDDINEKHSFNNNF